MKNAITLAGIAVDIERLKPKFPQLRDFEASRHFDPDRLIISYDYHTHAPGHRRGWTSGVPNPDDDGLWFFIDVHDPGSMAQIHTQPVMPKLTLGEMRVAFLILAGAKTASVYGSLLSILQKHGVSGPSF